MARKFKTPITLDELGSASSQAIAANVDGDSQNRINIDAGGKITWGSGSATGDTTLYRSAADTLKTDDAFTATSLAVTGQFTLPTSDGSASQVLQTNGSGTVSWADMSAAYATVSDAAPSSPSTGQIWYESDTGKTFVYYDSYWIEVGASPPASPFITDLDEDTKIQVEESADEDKIRFDTAGSERMIIDASGNVGIGTTSPSTLLHVGSAAVSNNIVTVTAANNTSAGIDLMGDLSGAKGFRVKYEGNGNYFAVEDNTSGTQTERMRIDASGNVGIGTASPNQKLDVDGNLAVRGKMVTGSSTFTQEPWANSTIALGDYGFIGTEGSYGTSLVWNWERGTDSGYYSLGVNSYTSAAAIHMRDDGIRFQYESSWGATSEPSVHTLMSDTELLTYKDIRIYNTNPGIVLQDSDSTGIHNGSILFTDSAGTIMGRVTMNGNDDLSIRAEQSGSILYFWAQGSWRFSMTNSQFLPYVDDAYDLGASTKRFDDVYATNASIIATSDVRDKTDIVDIDYGLDFVNSLRPVNYRMNDRSGYEGTRTHMGFVAQEVSELLGDDATNRAVWVNSPAGEYKNADTGEYEAGVERQGLRYSELIAPMVKAIQELTAQNETLTARIEALEAG